MCIIVAKEKNVKLPNEDVLRTCFDNNPDGAGFMYTRKNKLGIRYVVIDKGYMSYGSFIKRYRELCKMFNNFNNKALVMHFRIGTSGSNNASNTHPYPIASNHHVLQKTKIWCDLGVVHNGIIHDYTPPYNANVNNTNDTQEFIMKYLYPLHKNYKDFYKNEYIMDGLEDITNSKLAFLTTNDEIYYSGTFVENEGIKYSNETYKPWNTRYNYTPTTYRGSYDWDAYDGYGYEYGSEKETKKELVTEGKYVNMTLINWDNIVQLPEEWFLVIGNQTYDCFDKEFYYNVETAESYQIVNDKMYKIGDKGIVLDENYIVAL